jgi:hypothetical protein
MKSSGAYGLIVLALTIISSDGMVAGIGNEENGVGVIVSDRTTDRGVFDEAFNIRESLLNRVRPLELDALLGKPR